MMSETVFHFQQFSICHEHSAMKVGTDGILLGAWSTPITQTSKILDVGTGTGLIALMMAQRFPATVIEAVELDGGAAQDASTNFNSSPWQDRLTLHHADVRVWAQAADRERVDHLVSNPPFFQSGMPPQSDGRQMARHQGSLHLADLFWMGERLLTPEGRLELILPWESLESLRAIGRESGFQVNRLVRIRARPQKPITRMLVSLSRQPSRLQEEELTVRLTEGNAYSPDFIRLTSRFYLPGQSIDQVPSMKTGKERGASDSAYPPLIN